MDKKLINAVAGSGKTTLIIDYLDLEKKFLIFTYTENNFDNLKYKIIEKFGYMPKNICLYTYFRFLYNFCYRPYLSDQIKDHGIEWNQPPDFTRNLKQTNMRHFLNSYGKLYSNRIAKLLEVKCVEKLVANRLIKYFDYVFVDEIQDYGGYDINFLLKIVSNRINFMFVGDFFQHTYDTSRDGVVNKNLHKVLSKYIEKFKNEGFVIDDVTLKTSYRCPVSVCEFIQQKLNINIESNRVEKSSIMLLDKSDDIDKIVEENSIIKLFYQNSKKYLCNSMNWGESKGLDCFNDVCVVLNSSTYKLFVDDKLCELNPLTKNKLYVACTRTRGILYLVKEADLKKYKIQTPSDNTPF